MNDVFQKGNSLRTTFNHSSMSQSRLSNILFSERETTESIDFDDAISGFTKRQEKEICEMKINKRFYTRCSKVRTKTS